MKKILTIAGILIASIIIMPLITAIFLKKDYDIEKQIIINQPKQMVFDYVKLMKNHDEFTVWSKIDPKAKKEFRSTDGNVGFVTGWESDVKDVGKGELEIKKITGNERIDYELRFYKPYESITNTYMITSAISENITIVKWGLNGRVGYPMNFFLLFVNMQKMVGNDLEKGLVNLKSVLERK